MLKLRPIEFDVDFTYTNRNIEGRRENGKYFYNRKINISFHKWNFGSAMQVVITEDTDDRKNIEIFNKWYYDKDYPNVATRMNVMNDCRGRAAETFAFEIFMEIAANLVDEYFPEDKK